MFVFGETKEHVTKGKLMLPSAYHLKGKVMMAKWKDKDTLYLSDSDKALNFVAGRESELLQMRVDLKDRIYLPSDYEQTEVHIKGCISSIELVFRGRQELHV